MFLLNDWFRWDNFKETVVTYYRSEDIQSDLSLAELLSINVLENQSVGYFLALIITWLNQYFAGRLRIVKHSDAEKAFYAKEAWDIELLLDQYWWTEIAGVHHMI